jgi:NTP pyrophosphatase (non-canonical NTP hydrolase)
MINSSTYVKNATATESPITPEMIARFSDPTNIRLLHAGMGMVTEAGEFVDMLKKHLFYGKPLDLVNLGEEIGDSMWYIALAVDILQTTLDDVMSVNIAKLKARYPDKFTEFHAENRDLVTERKILENNKLTTDNDVCYSCDAEQLCTKNKGI